MKKIIAMVAMALAAGAVQAALIDGSFDGAGFFRESTNGKLAVGDIGSGWVDYKFGAAGATTYNWVGGYVERVATNYSGSRGFGQIFTMAVTGTQNVEVEWTQDENATGNRVRFDLYAFNSSSDATNISVSGWTSGTLGGVVRIGSYVNNGGDFAQATTTFSADFGTGYSYLAFVAIVDNDAGLQYNRVYDVNVVPEPATVGMLGLGALVTLLIRRFRR